MLENAIIQVIFRDFIKVVIYYCDNKPLTYFLKCMHFMAKNLWTAEHLNHIAEHLTGSILLGRLSTRCWNMAAGICFHSDVRSDSDVGWWGLAHCQIHPKSVQQDSSLGIVQVLPHQTQ